jgi:hypothetical protein
MYTITPRLVLQEIEQNALCLLSAGHWALSDETITYILDGYECAKLGHSDSRWYPFECKYHSPCPSSSSHLSLERMRIGCLQTHEWQAPWFPDFRSHN